MVTRPGYRAVVLALLRQRRWVGFTLLAVVLVLAFVRLSVWQVSRLHQRQAANDVERAHLSAPPMTYADLVGLARADPSFATDQQWRAVQVSGHWDAAHQVLVRNRVSDNGDNGYEVLTPLTPSAGGPALLVDRGWIPSGRTPSGPDSVPAAQTGTVTVTARLAPSEPARPAGGLPPGQVLSISTHDLGRALPYPALDAFAVLTSELPTPAGAPVVRAAPVLDDGPHLSYAVQWVLFAMVGIGGWWTFLRREAEEEAERAALDAERAADREGRQGQLDPPADAGVPAG
jgi:cytochrome oxidase assembly protein ShyY1